MNVNLGAQLKVCGRMGVMVLPQDTASTLISYYPKYFQAKSTSMATKIFFLFYPSLYLKAHIFISINIYIHI